MLRNAGMKRICPECSGHRIWSLKYGGFGYAKCRYTVSDPRAKDERMLRLIFVGVGFAGE